MQKYFLIIVFDIVLGVILGNCVLVNYLEIMCFVYWEFDGYVSRLYTIYIIETISTTQNIFDLIWNIGVEDFSAFWRLLGSNNTHAPYTRIWLYEQSWKKNDFSLPGSFLYHVVCGILAPRLEYLKVYEEFIKVCIVLESHTCQRLSRVMRS